MLSVVPGSDFKRILCIDLMLGPLECLVMVLNFVGSLIASREGILKFSMVNHAFYPAVTKLFLSAYAGIW